MINIQLNLSSIGIFHKQNADTKLTEIHTYTQLKIKTPNEQRKKNHRMNAKKTPV